MHGLSLAALRLGAWGVMRCETLEPGTGRRLGELGLVAGTRVRHLYTAPAGSPMAFSIRGAVIALRREDARNIAISGK